MKQCPNCCYMIIDTAKFCTRCGFNIKKYEEENTYHFCPECGTESNGAFFCSECGYKLIGESGAAYGESVVESPSFKGTVNNPETECQQEQEEEPSEFIAFEYISHTDGTYTITALKDKGILKIEVPEGVVAIADGAFEGATFFSVTLPEGLLKIGDRAFADCIDLNEINLPNSLSIIGAEAFAGCATLEVELPANVRKIGEDVLKGTLTEAKEEALKAEERAEEERKQEKACLEERIIDLEKAISDAKSFAADREEDARDWREGGYTAYANKYTDEARFALRNIDEWQNEINQARERLEQLS